MSDTITILNSLGPLMAKTFLADGSVKSYDLAKNFTHRVAPVAGIGDVFAVLSGISTDQTACVVRGTPVSGVSDTIERNLRNLSDTAHNWVALDIDNFACDPGLTPVEQADSFIRAHLPVEFHDISYVMQLSSSFGVKPGFRGRLWFWLAQSLAWREIEAWAYWACANRDGIPYVDVTVFRPAQVIYTASPMFEDGAVDPVAQAGYDRVTFVAGWAGDFVDLVLPPSDWVQARERRTEAGRDMLDPRSKPGVIGAWCRHVGSAVDCIDLYLSGHLEHVIDHRYTWLGGSSPEGAFVSTDGQHIVITNATFVASNSAMNAFDACRVLLFGDQDPAYQPGRNVTALPSYAAMLEFVRSEAKLHPELAAELDALTVPAGPDADEAFGDLDDSDDDAAVVDSQPVVRQPTRADLMAKVQAKLAELNSSTDIELYVSGLAGGDWIDSERAQIADWAQTRAAALVGRGAPNLRTVQGWLKRPTAPAAGAAVVAAYPHMTSTVPARPKNTLDNIRVLLSSRGLRLVYDEISKEQYLQDADGRRMSLGELSSLANEDDFTPTWAASTAQGWLRSMPAADWVPVNPALDWVRSRPWDGVPRIDKLAETLVLEDPTPENVHRRGLYVRKWCLQAVAMLLSTGSTQARGVLTLVGPQNLGKTRWVSSLAPGWTGAGNADMLHSKDGLIAATKMWICELAELEGNTRKADITALKAFLTQKQDTFRRPYAAEAEDHIRRTVFVGSANAEELLADQTGNSRFWAIKVRAMDYEHGIDTQQVFAEALAALESGEKHWFAAEETEIIERGNRDFEMPDPMLDLIETKLDWASPHDAWVFNRASILCGSLLGRVPSRGDAITFGLAFSKACEARSLPKDWTIRRSKLGNLIRHPPVLRGGGLD